MNLKEIPYYVGLDCGTSSVGFAVTDKNYNLLKAKNKDMWGSHLFDEANTAEARRIQRNARKRLARRNERIKLLQSIFAEEIAKIDPTFFIRLNESSLYQEDRSKDNDQPFSLFNDKDYTDKDFKIDFPTIYHLRAALLDGSITKKDPRFVYLALHHIVKNRGHFLFPGESLASIQNIGTILQALKECSSSIFEEDLTFGSQNLIEDALKIKKKTERIETLKSLIFSNNDKRKLLIIKAIAGYSIQPKNLFENDEYDELPKLEFQKSSFEEQDLPKLEETLQEDEYKLVESLKALYDWSLLANIMAGKDSISKAKIDQYNKNKQDLTVLKKVIRKYFTKEEYEAFFHSNKEGSFSNYIGSINSKHLAKGPEHKTRKRVKRTNTDVFYAEVKKTLKKITVEDSDVNQILSDIENDSFLPLLRSFRNGVVPFQVNLAELKEILEKSEGYLPWLEKKDEDGLSAEDKIISIMKFRIPYYVGPLADPSKNRNAWLARKESGRILPWNFEKKVDVGESAERFIMRMTNKCTYLPEEDVIPKQSLLYQNFMVLNEINNLKINSEDISVEQKQTIYYKLFRKGNVTQKKIKNLAITEGWVQKGDDLILSGIDDTIKASLSSYIAFAPYLESGKLNQNEVEDIIRWLTLFSDGGDIAKRKIESTFSGKLSKDDIKAISRMKFSGWGNLSKKFLTGIDAIDPETGEYKNIIRLLWDTNYNLMEILHNPECGILEQLGNKEPIDSLNYSILGDLRISPKVKRQIWQALRITKEIEHIMGHKPEKVFIEVARYEGEKGKRTKTRKDQLLEKIKKAKDPDDNEILKSLESEDASMITKRDRLYLYYTQLGKCMYSEEDIDLDDLLGKCNKYDIDHIYPYSKSNDDSLTNKVIVKSELNREKSNDFPIKEDIRIKMNKFWKKLLEKELISSEKYHRLTRSTTLSDEDLKGFINRQIVETSQSTKALAEILKRYFGEETKIVYSKAGNVSDFRKDFDLPKSRIINHLHHAKDAYLNIVVGNTLYCKYTSAWFLKNVNFNNPYKYNVEGAWIADSNKTISLVKATMDKNTVLFTRQPEMRTGQLFDLNPKAKGSEKGMIPLKMIQELKEQLSKNPNKEEIIKAWTDKYGGYNSLAVSHFALVRHLEKKKQVYTFVKIIVIRAQELLDKENLLKYCVEELGYKDVEIIRTKVLFNTLLSVDGFLMTITNSMNKGATLGNESAIPLILENKYVKYVKKLEKFTNAKRLDKNLLIDEKYDEISREENIELYELLLKKCKLYIMRNRPGNSTGIIERGEEVFTNLPIEQQTQTLMNILNYLSMGNGCTDFSLIGGGKANGTLTLSSTIDPSKKKVCIFDQSITGIYEERLKLE